MRLDKDLVLANFPHTRKVCPDLLCLKLFIHLMRPYVCVSLCFYLLICEQRLNSVGNLVLEMLPCDTMRREMPTASIFSLCVYKDVFHMRLAFELIDEVNFPSH